MSGREAHLRWLRSAEHWGEWVRFVIDGDDDYIDVHGDHESIWLMRRGGRCRFYQVGKGQVGPEFRSVVAASHWAWSNDWLNVGPHPLPDPTTPEFTRWLAWQLECRRWVLAGGAGDRDHLGDEGVVVGVAPEMAS